MKKITLCLALTLFWFSACFRDHDALAMGFGNQTEAYQVALHTFGFWDEQQKIKLDVALWYPGQTQTRISEYDGWMVQACSHRLSAAKVIPGTYPVILLSHDTASSYFANNDIAAHLASQGFFVIVPAHSGDTTTDGKGIYQASLLHDRPLQLLKALDLVLSNPDFAPFVDESRIGLLGVGTGAITVAQLSGAEPQAELFTTYCQGNQMYDLTCAGWTENLLKKFANDFEALKNQWQEQAFTPALDTFAPKILERVAIPSPLPVEDPEGHKDATAQKNSGKNNSDGDNDDKNSQDNKEQQSVFAKIRSLFMKKAPKPKKNIPAKAEIDSAEPAQLLFDFHGGYIHTETFNGNAFVFFKSSDTNDWIHPVTLPEKEPRDIVPRKQKAKDVRPFRRPADMRQIKAIAFVAPMGAVFFDCLKPNLTLPALSIFPEYSALYPHSYQAEPYRQLFPSYHEVEVISGADHFSLFASCTEQARSFLPESCGNLSGDAKKMADETKKAALRLFFKQYLGEPNPPQPPTGLKAVHEYPDSSGSSGSSGPSGSPE